MSPIHLGRGLLLVLAQAAASATAAAPAPHAAETAMNSTEPGGPGSATTFDAPLVVTDEMTITGTASIKDLLVEEEGHLRMESAKASLAGDVTIRGTLEFVDAEVDVATTFAHERLWQIVDGRLSAQRTVFNVPYNVQVEATGADAFFEFDRVTVGGGGLFTVTSQNRGAITLSRTRGIGEFIVPPDSPFRARNASHFLLWLVLAEQFPSGGILMFPSGESVAHWSPEGFDVEIENGIGVLWGIITAPGVRATIRDAKLRAVASVFGGPGTTTIRDIHTNALPAGGRLAPGDREIVFMDSQVQAWNFYTVLGHNLIIEDSTVGEAWGLDGTGSITVRRSTLDGSGGTVRARGETTLVIEDSTVVPQVIAQENARIEIRRSRVENDVNVTGDAVVVITETAVAGELRTAGRGRVQTTP